MMNQFRTFIAVLCVFLTLDNQTRVEASETVGQKVIIVGKADEGAVRSSNRNDLAYYPMTRGERATRVLEPHIAHTEIRSAQGRGSGGLVTFANENLQDGENATVQAGFESQDVAVAVLDIPSGYFPLEVQEVEVVWQSATGSPQQVATDLLFYENGVLRQVVAGAIMTGSGLMRVVIPTSYDMVFTQGPLAIGVKYHGTISGTVDSSLGHVVSAGTTSEECTPGANLIWDDAQAEWFDPCSLGMFGNFAIRSLVEPLCPAADGGPRIGDIHPDGTVNLQDWAILSEDLAGPGVMYGHGDFRRRSDLDTNGVVDLLDAAEFQRRFGDSVPCSVCPPLAGDVDRDDDVDLDDTAIFAADLETTGPAIELAFGNPRLASDLNNDSRVDLKDFALMQIGFGLSCPALAALENGAFPDVRPELLQLPTHLAEGANLRFTLVQFIIAIFILAIIVAIVGPCVQDACRQGQKANFAAQGSITNSFENSRLVQALDCLQEYGFNGDQEAEQAWFWWSQAQAYNSHIFGNPNINRDADEEEIEFVATILLNQVTIHHSFITGQNWALWGKDSLVLVLFAEWQHADCPTCSEEQLQPDLMDFRERNDLVDVAAGFGHGFGD